MKVKTLEESHLKGGLKCLIILQVEERLPSKFTIFGGFCKPGATLKFNFDDDFLWGVSTSAHQIEGNNTNSDWWKFEAEGKIKNGDRSGKACNSSELYHQDIELAKALNVNAFRFSVEWAKVEPREGEFDQEVLHRYADEVIYMQKNGIEPMVTLHHFTNPLWIAEFGGWESKRTIAFFLRYVQMILDTIGSVKYFITINEPNVYALFGYLQGYWPPEIKNRKKMKKVLANMALAHSKVYDLIHSKIPDAKVSTAINTAIFRSKTSSPLDLIMTRIVNYQYNFSFLDSVFYGKTHSPVGKITLPGGIKLDFIGLNYYTRFLVGFGFTPKISFGDLPKTEMGYEIYPQGIKNIIEIVWKRYKIPIIITENGVADGEDKIRPEYIMKTLESLSIAVSEGVKLKGYFHWSLMDNFEWLDGFGPRFGLYHTDFRTFKRTLRKSGELYSKICSNQL